MKNNGRFRGGPPSGHRSVGHGGPRWNFRESIATSCHTTMQGRIYAFLSGWLLHLLPCKYLYPPQCCLTDEWAGRMNIHVWWDNRALVDTPSPLLISTLLLKWSCPAVALIGTANFFSYPAVALQSWVLPWIATQIATQATWEIRPCWTMQCSRAGHGGGGGRGKGEGEVKITNLDLSSSAVRWKDRICLISASVPAVRAHWRAYYRCPLFLSLPLSTVLLLCTWPRPNMNPGSTDQINSCDGEIHHDMVLINQASTVLLMLSVHYIHVATPSKTPNQHGP
jgi:hypothetical protein